MLQYRIVMQSHLFDFVFCKLDGLHETVKG